VGGFPYVEGAQRKVAKYAQKLAFVVATRLRNHDSIDMPITYTIDVPRALIVTRGFGQVTLAEVREHFQELARVWPPVDRLDVLLDLTEQTSLPTLGDLEKVATEVDEQIGARRFGRCAVVTAQNLHAPMQMFEVLVGTLFDAIEIFPTPFAALVWLLPTPKVSRTLSTQ
jgi:hypothetical protein